MPAAERVPLGSKKGVVKKKPTRRGRQLNLWVHEDAAQLLRQMADITGRTQRELVEQAIYDAWDLFEARMDGAELLLRHPGQEPEYSRIQLGVRIPKNRT
ncbi:MAG TPA: hypothetical protein VF228_16680 [Iamia sp.]